jgi:PAS domain S-box-containing protein
MKTVDSVLVQLSALVDSADDAIISHAMDGTVQIWNRAAERLFGYVGAEIIGRPIDDIVPPELRDEDRRLIASLHDSQSVNHVETVGLTKDGRLVPISLGVSSILSPDGRTIGVSRIARDLSGQKALEREALRLAAIVDSSEDAIVSKDLNGIVQTWNRSAERMFGYTADEMVGRPILVIIPPDRHPEESEVLARIRAGIPVEHYETVRQRKDGSFIEISLSVSPIRTSDGTVVGASKIARDISLQRQLALEAAEANRVKDEFLATLSHELRTPLNAVMGYTRMLRMGQLDGGRQERAIDIIDRNVQILSQLVSDVLDVSSIVTGKTRLKLAPCDLVGAVGSAVDIIRPSAEAKDVALRLESPGELRTRCDTDRLQQVFWNLLSNAVKFTPRGGTIDIRLAEVDGSAEVSIRDTGIGIRPESLPLVFHRFWQGESVTSREFRGLGLGLALARHFVELHGGTIAADSAGEGQGATFTVRLPMVGEPS